MGVMLVGNWDDMQLPEVTAAAAAAARIEKAKRVHLWLTGA
jgi:hypothetical protein